MQRMAMVLGALALSACGPQGRGPEPVSTPRVEAAKKTSRQEERLLDEAVAKARAGDVEAAHALVEQLSPTSPGRLDPRYDEVEGAWSDARIDAIGRQIAAPRGGGPRQGEVRDKSIESPLDRGRVEKLVDERRTRLRDACFEKYGAPSAFVLTFHVDPNGMVRDAHAKDIKGDQRVALCVQGWVNRWRFPESTDGGEFETRMIFAP